MKEVATWITTIVSGKPILICLSLEHVNHLLCAKSVPCMFLLLTHLSHECDFLVHILEFLSALWDPGEQGTGFVSSSVPPQSLTWWQIQEGAQCITVGKNHVAYKVAGCQLEVHDKHAMSSKRREALVWEGRSRSTSDKTWIETSVRFA